MDRNARLVENERLLREANREIEAEALEAAVGWQAGDYEAEFFCACGRLECHDKLLIGILDYERMHEEPHRFLIVPGHANPEVERVVERRRGYEVVEKLPEYWLEDGR